MLYGCCILDLKYIVSALLRCFYDAFDVAHSVLFVMMEVSVLGVYDGN